MYVSVHVSVSVSKSVSVSVCVCVCMCVCVHVCLVNLGLLVKLHVEELSRAHTLCTDQSEL